MISGIILSTKRTESFIVVVFQSTFIKHLCLLGQCLREACDEQLPEFLLSKGLQSNGGKVTQTQRIEVMQCSHSMVYICIVGAEEQGTFFEFQNWYHHELVK